jgi:hypothetical protein
MGYPNWKQLASLAIETVRVERLVQPLGAMDAAMNGGDFPFVLEQAREILGGPRLLQVLQGKLVPSRQSEIYKQIARWPVPVYLTTNYDDEIQEHLADLGESYLPYSNSEDHLSYLLPDFTGAVVKLHGDLRTEVGLILTKSSYREIGESEGWQYWRTKMTSVFQMNRIVIIGHSLTDKNIQHVLESAKQGSGVHQPICWIAPDVSPNQTREFLEKYRIRVISYDNRDDTHRNLVRLIDTISQFVPPRKAIHIQDQIARISNSPLGQNAAAPGFFVFNKLAILEDYEQRRAEILVAAIQAAIPTLTSSGQFSLKEALEVVGWPKGYPLASDLEQKVCNKAIEEGMLASHGDRFRIGDRAVALTAENRSRFEHLRERFKEALRLRLRRDYPNLPAEDATLISNDIEMSLTGYFREGGLSLATTLFSSRQDSGLTSLPSSIIKFISEASTRYDDLLMRQAFCSVSLDAFLHAGSAEREYLGRVSQGFFAFHSLGAFGEVAIERLRHAKETVWLLDSEMQIAALALGTPTNHVFSECLSKLRAVGIRLFTTERLFDETREHLWFADKVIDDHGAASHSVIAAARGEDPYRKSNQFLEGFVRWQSAGNPCDWEGYKYRIFGRHKPSPEDLKKALSHFGVDVVPFQDWPGFSEKDFHERDSYTRRITEIRDGLSMGPAPGDHEFQGDSYKKAQPEAEAFLVVKREREGRYHVISQQGDRSPSWFVSHTSILTEPITK